MKGKINNILLKGSMGKTIVTVDMRMDIEKADDAVQKIKKVLERGNEVIMEIKQLRKGRSLNANGMLWAVMTDIADALSTPKASVTKDDVYLQMLERYGVYTHIIVRPDVVERVKEEWRTVRELGEVIYNGEKGIELQCYFGSHSYNTKEFSTLLNGVLTEAEELGIETMCEEEKNALLEEWDKREEK